MMHGFVKICKIGKRDKMKVLVTGCCGYIGSHTCVELLENGYEVVGLDNFSNSKKEVLDRIHQITSKTISFYEGDMLDEELLTKIFETEKPECVIDFAAYKAVGESVQKPIEYYTNNVSSVLTLLRVMKKKNVKSLVFSSSATVYGTPKRVPIEETDPTGNTTNPYGTSKLFVEKILSDVAKSDDTWRICILRYFNPIGAHKSGLLFEDPKGIPANLMPYMIKVATKELECLNVFGNDYDTKDGTGVRDYIHVVDLALGHIKAIEKIKDETGVLVYNLGTGKGTSVLELIETFAEVNHVEVPYQITDRRPGDSAACYADATKAKEELGWEATKNLEDMCKDAYHFVKKVKNL